MKNHFAFIYQATVAWYDGESNHYRVAGLGFCENFTDAMRQIEEREGETLESIEHLELIGERDDSILEISPSMVHPLIDYDPYDFEPYTKEVN